MSNFRAEVVLRRSRRRGMVVVGRVESMVGREGELVGWGVSGGDGGRGWVVVVWNRCWGRFYRG